MMRKEKSLIYNILIWLDDNLISILAGFLLIFIPLYPKLPLFDVLPGYIVRIRFEDFFILFTFIIWLIWIFRGKITVKDNPLFKPILIYLLVGILSMFSAVFIIKTVPLETLHVGKMVLHFLRRIEYFSLFFILFSAVRKPYYVKMYIFIILLVLTAVSIYGFGQKYLYWPAFSTMNREFAKGWMLYLTEHSRVLSTFGGHYDLAAYTMMMLVLSWSLFFGIRNKIGKILVFLVISLAFWLLILTASRTSFLAYLGAVSVAVFLWVFKKSLGWMVSRLFIVLFLSIFVMLSFGDLSERFSKILRIEQRLGGLRDVLLRPVVKPPLERAVFLVNNLEAVTVKSDQPPSPYKPEERPSDVYEDIPEPVPVASDSQDLIYKPRTYSKTALQYDLSTGIRLDALWPRAIAGFLRNPLLGSSYSTLTKTQIGEFTEAESTDNDFLRMLGETGLLGTIAFLAIIFVTIRTIWKILPGVKDNFLYALFVATIALSLGLLINAVYIDVFEASKVAYTYWGLIGLVLGLVNLKKQEFEKNKTVLKIHFNWSNFKRSFIKVISGDKFLLIIIVLVAFYLRLYKIDAPVADWHSWRQADTAAVTRNFERNGINFLYPTFDDLSSIPSGRQNPKGLRMVEFPLYNAVTIVVKRLIPEGPLERAMRLTSIFASLGSLVFLFLLVKRYLGRKTAFVTAIIFAILPYNIYYSRVILPEPFAVFLSLGFLYFFDQFLILEKNHNKIGLRGKYFILSFIFGSAAILVKPFTIFLLLPAVYLAYRYFSWRFLAIKKLYFLALLVVIPFILWRLWISQFPEGIPAYQWLFNGDGIRFKGAFFYWLFGERVAKLILGYWGLPFLILGLIVKIKKGEGWLFRWLGIGAFLYLVIVATGNVRHDYYQVLIIPALIVFVAKGIDYLLSTPQDFNKFLSILFLVISVLFMEAFGWYYIRDFFNINHPEIVEAGRAVDEKTKKGALVIAPYNGDTAFLYQTNRAGWPIVEGTIEDLIKKGADYYVSVNFDALTKQLIEIANDKHYKIIDLTPRYVIIQLVPNWELPSS